jgi:LAO/AO transport system kinase
MEHPENEDIYKGLKVNSGVADVPTVNPYIKKRVQRRQYTPAEFVEGILKGDITVLSQAVTLVESSRHDHQAIAQEIIEKCLPYAGKSMRVGITGVPGAGIKYIHRCLRNASHQTRTQTGCAGHRSK